MIYVGAVGDVHSPKNLDKFSVAMKKFKDKSFDLFILAGDSIHKGFLKGFNIGARLNSHAPPAPAELA